MEHEQASLQESTGAAIGVLYCTVHPTAETGLRCNKCGRPMCTKCAISTPVGYRCRECVRGQQKAFYNNEPLDPLIQGAIALILSGVAAGLIGFVGGSFGFFAWIITFLVGSAVGTGIASFAHQAVGRRRSQYGWLAVAAGIVIGVLPALVLTQALVVLGIYAFTAVSGAVGMLRMGRKRI